MVFKVKLLIIFLFFLMNHSFARTAWTGKVFVDSVYEINQYKVGFKLSKFNNPASCYTTKDIDVIVDSRYEPETLYYMDMAFSDEKKVDLWIRDKCESAHWPGSSFGKIGHVRVFRSGLNRSR